MKVTKKMRESYLFGFPHNSRNFFLIFDSIYFLIQDTYFFTFFTLVIAYLYNVIAFG